MEKIILANSETLEFSKFEGFNITVEGKTIEELEKLFTKSNLIKIQVVREDGVVYGVYNNLICDSITKNLTDNSITANLSKLDDTQVKIEELQKTIDTLVLANLGV
jgi:endonuclease V-like protein UPF0215 family